MLRLAATSHSLHLPVCTLLCSGEAIALANASVDLVLMIEVLQFVENDEGVVREVGRVLRSDGVWLCEQEVEAFGEEPVLGLDVTLTKRRVGYSAEALCSLASRAGLILEDSRMVEGPIGRWWHKVEAHMTNRWIYPIVFPFIFLLAAVTANPLLDRKPATVLYRFRKRANRT
jgi:hypothetical protein